MQKYFDDFKNFLSYVNFTFKVICLAETWLHDAKHAARFNLSNYQMINLYQQNDWAEEGLYAFIHETIDFKERKGLSISKNDSEKHSIEITNKTKYIILSVYRPPDCSVKNFKALKHQFLITFVETIRISI